MARPWLTRSWLAHWLIIALPALFLAFFPVDAQWRLLPYVIAAYVLYAVGTWWWIRRSRRRHCRARAAPPQDPPA